MKFEDTYEKQLEVINQRLDEIEKKEHVRILHAVESGSRSWGFASPDSDFDVRFVYVREPEFYLKLEETKDFINWELNEVLDIVGWDITKVLKLFYKSNITLFEWANSPIVYRTTKEWNTIYETCLTYFSQKKSMYQYYGTATSNYQEYLLGEQIKYKKYFYVIRPLLACKWIDERKCPPPVLFDRLRESVLKKSMQDIVEQLLQQKVKMKESELGVRVDALNDYIKEQLSYYKSKLEAMQDDRKSDWKDLNEMFLKTLKNRTE